MIAALTLRDAVLAMSIGYAVLATAFALHLYSHWRQS